VTDPLRQIVSRLDRERQPVVTAPELRRWPAGAADFALKEGLLRESEPAMSLVYDGCEDHCVVTPALSENPATKQMVAVHYCRRAGCGRITFEPDELRQWQPSMERLATMLASELDMGTLAVSIVPDRVYLIGILPTSAGPLDVFLGRGLAWDDAPTVLASAGRLKDATGPALIVLKDCPPAGLLQGRCPTVIALSEHLTWNERDDRIDFGQLAAAIRSVRPAVPPDNWMTVSECAKLFLNDVDGLNLEKAKARISWAASQHKFRTNGKKGNARRIDRDSFSTWRLKQRERDLDAEDEGRE